MHRLAAFFALLALATSGCGASVSDPDLGEVIYHVPQIPGREHPYVMPELGDEPPPPPAKPRSRLTTHAAAPSLQATPAPASPSAAASAPAETSSAPQP